MFGVKGFAKGLAKAQLRSFLAFRSKYPDMKPEELYLATIKTRPHYTEDMILGLISHARASSQRDGYPLNFQQVVISLAEYEFATRTGYDLRPNEQEKIREAVKKAIPTNI